MKKLFAKIRSWTALAAGISLNLGGLGIKNHGFCAPSYNCHGCPWSTFACPIGASAFQASIGKFPLMALSFLLLIGATCGRFVCGYVCPVGLFQDCMHKIPSKKLEIPKWTRYIKYLVLLFLVLLFPYLMGQKYSGYIEITDLKISSEQSGKVSYTVTVENNSNENVSDPQIDFTFTDEANNKSTASYNPKGITIKPGESADITTGPMDSKGKYSVDMTSPQTSPSQTIPIPALYFCKICPVGTMTASLPAAISKKNEVNIFQTSAMRFIILILFLIAMVFVSRIICRTFCPFGAIYGLTNKLALFRMSVKDTSCVKCGICNKVCPVGLDVTKEIGGPECLACGDCAKKCPKKAIFRQNILQKDKTQ